MADWVPWSRVRSKQIHKHPSCPYRTILLHWWSFHTRWSSARSCAWDLLSSQWCLRNCWSHPFSGNLPLFGWLNLGCLPLQSTRGSFMEAGTGLRIHAPPNLTSLELYIVGQWGFELGFWIRSTLFLLEVVQHASKFHSSQAPILIPLLILFPQIWQNSFDLAFWSCQG